MEPKEKKSILKITNKTYDILKWVAQYLLPALGTLYFTLASIWGLPYGEQIVGSIAAIDTFLGIILGMSSSKYEGDGVLQIDSSDPAKDKYRLKLDIPLNDLPKKSTAIFKIDPGARL